MTSHKADIQNTYIHVYKWTYSCVTNNYQFFPLIHMPSFFLFVQCMVFIFIYFLNDGRIMFTIKTFVAIPPSGQQRSIKIIDYFTDL